MNPFEAKLRKLPGVTSVSVEIEKQDRWTWHAIVKVNGRIIASTYIPGWHGKSDINKAKGRSLQRAYERIARDGVKGDPVCPT